MYPFVAYCLFVVSTLGATSFHPVVSLPRDTISGDASSAHPHHDDERPLVPVPDPHETGSEVPEDAGDSFSVSPDVIHKLDSRQPSNDETITSHRFKKPSAGANKAKVLFGRSWSPSHRPQWSPLIVETSGVENSEPTDNTGAEHNAKRLEPRRHFKLGKKSLDSAVMFEKNQPKTTASKRKMIKFGKKSLSKESDELLASA